MTLDQAIDNYPDSEWYEDGYRLLDRQGLLDVAPPRVSASVE